eukprot:2169619-Heterocapsa_arctica.AAC.1
MSPTIAFTSQQLQAQPRPRSSRIVQVALLPAPSFGARALTPIADSDLAQVSQPAEHIHEQHTSKASSFTPGS